MIEFIHTCEHIQDIDFSAVLLDALTGLSFVFCYNLTCLSCVARVYSWYVAASSTCACICLEQAMIGLLINAGAAVDALTNVLQFFFF